MAGADSGAGERVGAVGQEDLQPAELVLELELGACAAHEHGVPRVVRELRQPCATGTGACGPRLDGRLENAGGRCEQ
ncbi:hypothetical protein PMKS-000979 [Pichia membranifaciens]|uniref:Uncharacterized protein n=1 Tax=Pichia membranifaciens TaxID=4926 RepID=A0A1Q2YDD0_9ASCO|nr:hypothetical protein PMKS-000979 [Pichia membranifaciens]